MTPDTQVLKSLAFLYLTFGHSTDGTLTAEEMRALADKLRARSPALELHDLGVILKETVATYKATPDKLGAARKEIEGLARSLGQGDLRSVLDDLEAIADADGEISEAERDFIVDTARTFKIR